MTLVIGHVVYELYFELKLKREKMIKKVLMCALLIAGVFQINAQEAASEDSPWQARFRVIAVMPSPSATIEAIGGDVDISNAVVPELDFTYFFSENLAAELILGTAKHSVEAIETAAGDIELGDIWLLPPTLTLQYHFNAGSLKPYLGAGLNYTIFYGGDAGPVADGVSYENSLGYAAQLGFDYMLNDKWFINLDVKKLFLGTDVTVDATTALEATVGAEVDINPLILGLGVGMKF